MKTVRPPDRAYLGVPQGCPTCGGQIVPSFGMTLGEDGRRYPYIDPEHARCRDCGEMFKTDRYAPMSSGS